MMLTCDANRGIGLSLTRHLLKHTNLVVVATSRTPSEGRAQVLENLGDAPTLGKRLHNLELDVQHEESIAQAAGYVSKHFGKNLRLLINVSGVVSLSPPFSVAKPFLFIAYSWKEIKIYSCCLKNQSSKSTRRKCKKRSR
jgi:NAD(P)-dependent dehydrogenase (short-subunit alcohol dehydrogenase family)